MASSLDQFPQRDGMYSVLPDGVAVYNRYQKRIMMLDGLTSEFWLRADGTTSLRNIALDMAGYTGQSAEHLLRTLPAVLVVLSSEGLMYQQNNPTPPPYHLALPKEDQDEEQTRQSMNASGWTD